MPEHLVARESLGTLTKLGQGGQGIVYRAPKAKTKFADAMVFKEYKPQAREAVDFEALAAMPTLVEDTLTYLDGQRLISISAWPCALVENNTRPVGFVMPAIPDPFHTDLTTVKGVSRTTAEFQHLLNPPAVLSARGITITDTQRYELLREVAKALAFLHRTGVCVGDISPKNLLFSLQPYPAVYFIDCDAMRINGTSVLPQMETPEWEVPTSEELATIYSDTYKLGLLALRLLTGDQHTKSMQQLPSGTPKMLRQLITDTLSDNPDRRPVPEAWAYLLGHVIKGTRDHLPTPQPKSSTHPPEPQPVVRSRPTTTAAETKAPKKSAPPAPANVHNPSAISAQTEAPALPKGFWVLAAGVVVFLIAMIALTNSASHESPHSTGPTTSTSSTSPAQKATTTKTSPTAHMGDVERSIRNARVGDCFRKALGPEKPDQSQEIVALYPKECGNADSEIRIVSKDFFSTWDPPQCGGSEGRMWSYGAFPRVVLCWVLDPAGSH